MALYIDACARGAIQLLAKRHNQNRWVRHGEGPGYHIVCLSHVSDKTSTHVQHLTRINVRVYYKI